MSAPDAPYRRTGPDDVLVDVLGPEEAPSMLVRTLAADLRSDPLVLRRQLAVFVVAAEQTTVARTVEDLMVHTRDGVTDTRAFAEQQVARIELAGERGKQLARELLLDGLTQAFAAWKAK